MDEDHRLVPGRRFSSTTSSDIGQSQNQLVSLTPEISFGKTLSSLSKEWKNKRLVEKRLWCFIRDAEPLDWTQLKLLYTVRYSFGRPVSDKVLGVLASYLCLRWVELRQWVELQIIQCGNPDADLEHEVLFKGQLVPQLQCQSVLHGRKQMSRMPHQDEQMVRKILGSEESCLKPPTKCRIAKDIRAGAVTLLELQERFGSLPWSDGRVRVATLNTQRLSRGKRKAAMGSSVEPQLAVLPPCASTMGAPSTEGRKCSPLDCILSSLEEKLDPHQKQEGLKLLKDLRTCLQLTCGRKSRPKGGWEYSAEFLLDSVLFADNLRPIHESNVMQDAVRQHHVLDLDH